MRNVWENYGQTGRDIAESADRDAAWIARELGDVEVVSRQPSDQPTDAATIGAGYHSLGGIGYGVRGMPAGEYLGIPTDSLGREA